MCMAPDNNGGGAERLNPVYDQRPANQFVMCGLKSTFLFYAFARKDVEIHELFPSGYRKNEKILSKCMI